MSQEIDLQGILKELRAQNTPPLSIHTSGTVTYVIYGAVSIGSVTGYPTLRITEVTPEHTYIDEGFVPEELRVSLGDINLKTDHLGAVTVAGDSSVIYG